MPKLIILSRETNEYRELIQQVDLPDLEILTDPANCDIVLGEPRLIQNHLAELKNLKWVQSVYAGVEALVDPSQHHDYTLTNARGVFGELMSEYVFGYLLAHEKQIFKRHLAQQVKKWDRFESGMLHGKTIGLLGVGSIGTHIAGVAKAFAMNVWGFTRGSEKSPSVDKYFHPTGAHQGEGLIAFAKSLDYLVCVLPRTAATNQIVDADVFEALPAHAVFINVGRGNAVDELALVEALNQNKIAGAVLDVTQQEPLPVEHPFWTTPNLTLTFHTSAISYPKDIVRLFVENYQLYIGGKPLKHQVNFERGY